MTIRSAARWLALLLLSAPAPAWPQNEVISYLPGMLLGRGIDTVTGAVREDCAAFGTVNIPTAGLGQVSYSMTEITSSQDLFELTNVSAGASVSVGLFSASAEMSLLSQSEVSSYSASFLAWVSVERDWQYATGTALKPEFAALRGQDFGQFQGRCGDRFVAGVLSGGEFYGLISVMTESQSDRELVAASLRASYGPFSANGSVSTETKEALASHQTSITGYKTGGTATAIPMSIDQLQALAASFPAEVQASGGVPVRVLLLPYPGAPTDALAAAMEDLAALRWDYVTVAREAAYILGHPSQFYMTIATWRNFLQARRDEANAAAATVTERLQACRTAPSACSVPAGLRTPEQIRSTFPPRYAAACADSRFGPWNMAVYPLNHRCGGDKEMDGHNPSIDVTARLFVEGDGHELGVETYVKMKEDRSDWTCFDQSPWARRTFANLLLSHPGCYVASTASLSPNSGALAANGGKDNHDWTSYENGTGLVATARCRSDTGGDDWGEVGCNPVTFRQFLARLTHEELRMGPNDLAVRLRLQWKIRLDAVSRVRALAAGQEARLAPVVSRISAASGIQVAPPRTREIPRAVVPELKVLQPGRPPIH